MYTTTLATLALAAGSAFAAPLQKRGGIATYYQAGQGACGQTNSPSDYIVAIPSSLYGASGSVSSWCGKTITITNLSNGKTAQAKIQDECPTCVNSDSLDMSAGLFSDLNNGNMGAGTFPITWSSGSGSSNSKPSSSSTSSATASSTASSSSSAKPKQSPYSAPPHDSGTVAPSGSVSSNYTSTPSWWATIDPAYCNLKVPANVSTVAVGPTKAYNGSDLSDACGKWIDVTNPANNKTLQALVTAWVPQERENFLALTDGYKRLADMQGATPNPIANVTWGFIQNITKTD